MQWRMYSYPEYLLLERLPLGKATKYTFIFKWFTNFHHVTIPALTDSTYQCDCIEHEE